MNAVSPRLSYLVCGSQRCGSTLLCRALTDTGVAGAPTEYFLDGAPEHFPPGFTFWEDGPLARQHGVTTRQGYLELVYKLGSTPNGVFGVKFFWNNLPWILKRLETVDGYAGLGRAEALRALLPNLHAVYLTRRDTVRQAVSWARAAQDGVWVLSDTEPAKPLMEPGYNFEFIHGLTGLIAEGEAGWESVFAELAIEPLRVAYEDLANDEGYRSTIVDVLAYLEVDPQDASIPLPRTHRQADAVNDDWIARYHADLAEAS